MNTYHYTCVRTHKIYKTKNELWYKLRSLGDNEVSIQAHQKCTTLLGDVDNGKGDACIGTELIWEISVLSVQFCCELRTSLKK